MLPLQHMLCNEKKPDIPLRLPLLEDKTSTDRFIFQWLSLWTSAGGPDCFLLIGAALPSLWCSRKHCIYKQFFILHCYEFPQNFIHSPATDKLKTATQLCILGKLRYQPHYQKNCITFCLQDPLCYIRAL